ncbi:hypothetical protein ABT160_25850 [Streptomyces sp. NPDC001941]|uniref:hypothetical protein n=1 Tax=Streptomyces sp. NPDC001941 TaxID=3154659 RepID=UPI00331ECE6E
MEPNSEFRDDEVIYRRIPNKPDFLAPNLLTGEKLPTHTAFRWDRDGISVHRSSILSAHNLGPEAMVKKEEHTVYGFSVQTVRSCKAKLINDPDLDDPPIGIAHALIQGDVPKPEKPVRREISESLAQASRRYYPPEDTPLA